MKKTLAAVAVLGAFAASAYADVTVYGNLDGALVYKHAASGADTVQMKSSGNETTLVGFKGSEKISEDLTVGFKLEAAYNLDTGDGTANDLFKREALVYAKTAYGEFGFGRTGSLGASTGSYAFLGSGNTGWGGGVMDVLDNGFIFKGKASRQDNAVTYVSPKMGGVTLYAQVASAENSGDEFTHLADRYYALGAKYAAGALNAGLVVTQQDYNNGLINAVEGSDDATVVSGYVNYNFGVAKVALAAEFYDGIKAAKAVTDAAGTVTTAATAGIEGYGLTAAVVAPVCGGTATFGLGYGESENVVGGGDKEYVAAGARFVYPLSKQTGLYTGVGYTTTNDKVADTSDEALTAHFGLYTKF